MGFEDGTAAVYGLIEVVAVAVAVAGDANGAGASAGIDRVAGLLAEVKANGAGAGLKVRGTEQVSICFDVSGAGARGEGAIKAIDADGTGAGGSVDLALGNLLELDVARARVEVGGAGDAVGTDGAGAGLGLEKAAEMVDLEVAGAAAQVKGDAFGSADVVVDGDVVVEVAFFRGNVAEVNGRA